MQAGFATTLMVLFLGTFAAAQAPAPERQTPQSPGTKPTPSSPSTKPPETSRTGGSLSGDDKDFFTKASAAGHKEIALAKIAEQKGASSTVKALAERLQKDHMDADKELHTLAQSKSVSIPAPPAPKAETD